MCSYLSEESIYGNCIGRWTDSSVDRPVVLSSSLSLSLFFLPLLFNPPWLNFQSLRSLFPYCKRRPALSFSALSIYKVHRTPLFFVFVRVFFFCSISSIYQLGHAPFFSSPPPPLHLVSHTILL